MYEKILQQQLKPILQCVFSYIFKISPNSYDAHIFLRVFYKFKKELKNTSISTSGIDYKLYFKSCNVRVLSPFCIIIAPSYFSEQNYVENVLSS